MNKENEMSGSWRGNRQVLLEKRAELLANLRIELQSVGRASGVAEEDVSMALQEQAVAIQLKRIDYLQLKLVDAALARLEGKAAGVCVDCGKPISSKRLVAFPWASRCLVCQESAGNRDS